MASITLTASMRSNLSSLRTIASQMSKTQERLSSGKKVNSAIDNASSYYQARSLTNRAADLNALLDSMGQGIQTIQAATTGLEKAGEFLEQAAVIAQEAYEAAIIPEKAYFEAQVGENGAVVTSAQELKDAIAANKEVICVYGQINLEDTSISLKTGQKLVGTEYFTGYSGNKKFSQINNLKSISTYENFLVSDLGLSKSSGGYGIDACGEGAILQNVDYDYKVENSSTYSAPIIARGGHALNLCGTINIKAEWINTSGSSIYVYNGSSLNIKDGAKVYIEGDKASIRVSGSPSQVTIGKANVYLNEISSANGGGKIDIAQGATLSFPQDSFLNQEDFSYTFGSSLNYNKLKSLEEFESIGSVEWTSPTESEKNPYKAQYEKTLTALDELIADTSYQGINLLNGGDLTVTFNEDRTHSYTVNGSDMSSTGLGITTREWVTKQDVLDSINEIKSAMNTIRDEVARLGNSYQIIQTRENFTDGLTDILETGADNLVLADMNEESADYLSLQIRNNLAINALSLASQSAQSVLKLF